MLDVVRHLGTTVRSLWRQPGVTVPAVLTLALGIGATTALFAYLAALVWPAVEAPRPERVVIVYAGTPEEPRQQASFAAYEDFRRAETGIVDLTAYSPCGVSVNLGEQTTYAWGQLVSGGYFSFWGARPAAGRLLQPQDDRPEAPPVAVVSYAFWKGALGGDPRAMGRRLRMNGQTVTLVGVAPDRADRYDAPSNGNDPYLDSARLLTASSGLFLLLGCASIANLLLARATARRREWAVRAALGAGRPRLAGGVLLESFLLCLAGGLAGIPFAMLLARRIDALVVSPPPGFGDWGQGATLVHLDLRALGFALAVALACTLLGGLAPLLRLLRRDLLDPLKSDAAGSGAAVGALAARKLLVVAQVALSVLLLLGGGLLTRSLGGARHIDPGFSPDRLLLATVYVPRQVGGAAGSAQLYAHIVDRVRQIPGIRAATLALVPPLTGISRGMEAGSRDRPDVRFPVQINLIGVDYFSTLGIPILRGRALDRRDRRDAAASVVVNEALARKLWGTSDAVGRFIIAEPPWPGEPGPDFEVVGVAKDVRGISPVEPPGPLIYFSQEQHSHARMTIVARTEASALALSGELRRALRVANPDLAMIDLMTSAETLDRVLILPRMYAEIAGLFGLLGLAVAVVGLFGLLSYSVSLRRREMGIRMAVGARPEDVRRLVVRQGMALVAVGIAAGLLLAVWLSKLLAGLLFGVSAYDPLTFLAVPAGLALLALLACDLPARRAARVEPSAVLRTL